MRIEVTKSTFFLLFNSGHFTNTDIGELDVKHYYKNEEQSGVMVYNYVSDINQFYLMDINS